MSEDLKTERPGGSDLQECPLERKKQLTPCISKEKNAAGNIAAGSGKSLWHRAGLALDAAASIPEVPGARL